VWRDSLAVTTLRLLVVRLASEFKRLQLLASGERRPAAIQLLSEGDKRATCVSGAGCGLKWLKWLK
jgi:hypothetical protein